MKTRRGIAFMNTENYEQVFLNPDFLGDAIEYLLPNTPKFQVEYHDEKPIGSRASSRVVELLVTETDPIMKTATVTSSPKPAKLETGKTISVPQFIEVGEKIRVDTQEGKVCGAGKITPASGTVTPTPARWARSGVELSL